MKLILSLFFTFFIGAAHALPNPASSYCVANGGKLTLEQQWGASGWVGLCFFPDRSYCEEWHYFRNECKRGEYFLPKKIKGSTYCMVELPNKNLVVYLCKTSK